MRDCVYANHTTQSLIFFVLFWYVSRGGWSRWRATVGCCLVLRKSLALLVANANEEKQRSVGSIRSELALSFFLCRLESLRHVDGRRSTITSLASWRLCSSEPKRRRCRARARARRWPFFVFFCLALAERSCGGALLMVCASCSALCARLGVAYAVLGAVYAARRCVRSALCAARALLSIFCLHHYSDSASNGCISLPCKSGSSLLRLKR